MNPLPAAVQPTESHSLITSIGGNKLGVMPTSMINMMREVVTGTMSNDDISTETRDGYLIVTCRIPLTDLGPMMQALDSSVPINNHNQ